MVSLNDTSQELPLRTRAMAGSAWKAHKFRIAPATQLLAFAAWHEPECEGSAADSEPVDEPKRLRLDLFQACFGIR